ncbi:MAG: glycosyltransferase family 2 protein [Thermodesulfobacteriota bacterium]|nr:glycosyltransferase family 2 protein [Thermodesulfobacteriota bacterium]
MIPISVAIITKNEEHNIEEALKSIENTAEIIIVDAFSTDRTLDICRAYTQNIYQVEWQGYARQKQIAIEYATGPWVFVLDADERFIDSLKVEIAQVVNNSRTYCGYYVPRKNFFLGKWIQHGGWWPDYTLRLFLKDKACVEARRVHERIEVKGKVGYLKNPLEHYTYRTIADYIKKVDLYSTLSAEELSEKGKYPGITTLVTHPFFTFFKMFFLRFGFMDGVHGLLLAVLNSYYTFLKYVKLWEASIKNVKR